MYKLEYYTLCKMLRWYKLSSQAYLHHMIDKYHMHPYNNQSHMLMRNKFRLQYLILLFDLNKHIHLEYYLKLNRSYMLYRH